MNQGLLPSSSELFQAPSCLLLWFCSLPIIWGQVANSSITISGGAMGASQTFFLTPALACLLTEGVMEALGSSAVPREMSATCSGSLLGGPCPLRKGQIPFLNLIYVSATSPEQLIKNWIFFFFFNFFNVYLFLRERETEHEQERGRERGRHRI